MKPVSEVTACVVDHSLFLPVARRLARDFKKVYYFCPHERAFPSVQDRIGDGFADIEWTESPWKVKEECDLFVFPDIGFCHLQEELVRQGYPVWGSRRGDTLEISRGKFIEALLECGLPVAPYRKIEGLTQLREYLRKSEDLFIKISRFRGDWETKHWRSWAEDETWLDQKAVRFGPFRERILFYCFERVDTQIEDGLDTWCIQGACPQVVIHGMEAKDQAYAGSFQRYSELPEELRRVSDAFMPLLEQYGYQSFFSTEVRITKDGDSYFIDPTLRAGSPPSQIMCELLGNYGEIIWHGAHGQIVEPDATARFGVQAVLDLDGDPKDWTSLAVNDELDRWVKGSHCVMVDGNIHFAPDPCGHYLQWLTGIGDRLDEAIRHLQHNAKLLPEGTSCQMTCLADVLSEIQKAEQEGMPFSDQKVPKPAIVLEDKT